MSVYALLDQNEEDNLHALRLLNFEEKPFKRLAKKLLAPDSLVTTSAELKHNAPSDDDAAERDVGQEDSSKQLEKQRAQWQEDVMLDFAAYESNIIRVQFLLNSNERERERYAAEKLKILDTAQAVRENNTQLHEQLREAQRILAVRKGYDALADKITSDRNLKPRDEQNAQLEKLNSEIAELERESAEYSKTWAERRGQFGKIVEEGMQMLKLIRDEKEEAERKEEMEDIEDGDDAEGSKVGTPRLYGGSGTPAHNTQDGEAMGGFQRTAIHAVGATGMSKQSSRASSPALEQPDNHTNGPEMLERDQGGTDTRNEDRSEVEEGEETEPNNGPDDKMDVT